MKHPTCDTCRYWGNADEYNQGAALGAKACIKPVMLWNATEWSEDGDRVVCDPALKMFVQDGSDYCAELYTMADFYCYHHEPVDIR